MNLMKKKMKFNLKYLYFIIDNKNNYIEKISFNYNIFVNKDFRTNYYLCIFIKPSF